MNINLLNALIAAFGAAGLVFLLGALYFIFPAFFGIAKPKKRTRHTPATRFAVVVAARNEAAVIGQLVDSLLAQNYPGELYDVIVAPNNCTDDTRTVALAHGATVFDPQGPIHSKGDVLTQLVDSFQAQGRYDAICVFDADNLVHPDFLARMNDAYQGGVRVAQGFRDSKNPADSPISTCYSVGYWMANRFYNAGRQRMGLSALVNGCGFMVSLELMGQLGGWHTRTLTEDYEFSAQCALAGTRVQYIHEAIFYDEQPLTFRQSWKQRRRWSTGSIESMERYLVPLLRKAVKDRSAVCFDLAVTFIQPALQFLSLLFGLITFALQLWVLGLTQPHWMVYLPLAAVTLAMGAYFAASVLAAFVISSNRRGLVRGTLRGILFFALFALSCVPINFISIFKRQNSWEPTAHTRGLSLHQMGEKAALPGLTHRAAGH